jgi:hypothetical protein
VNGKFHIKNVHGGEHHPMKLWAMENKSTIAHIIRLIEDGNLGEALEITKIISSPRHKEDITHTKGRYSYLMDSNQKGIVTEPFFHVERNKIQLATIELVFSIHKELRLSEGDHPGEELADMIQKTRNTIQELNPLIQKYTVMELAYMDLPILISKFSGAAFRYFEQLFVPKDERLAQLKASTTIRDWEEELESYHHATVNTFNPDQMALYADYKEDFRNKVFGRALWTVRAALKTPDPDLARYKRDFHDAVASDVYETVDRLLKAAATYVEKFASTLDYNGIRVIGDLGLDFLNAKEMHLNKVIGFGIRSELLHRYYPAHFAIMTQKSLWAMHFLCEGEDKEFIVLETKKFLGKVRVSHNWQYPYDRFNFLMNVIANALEGWLRKYSVRLKPEYRFGYVNLFLAAFYESRKADARLLHEWTEN